MMVVVLKYIYGYCSSALCVRVFAIYFAHVYECELACERVFSYRLAKKCFAYNSNECGKKQIIIRILVLSLVI